MKTTKINNEIYKIMTQITADRRLAHLRVYILYIPITSLIDPISVTPEIQSTNASANASFARGGTLVF